MAWDSSSDALVYLCVVSVVDSKIDVVSTSFPTQRHSKEGTRADISYIPDHARYKLLQAFVVHILPRQRPVHEMMPDLSIQEALTIDAAVGWASFHLQWPDAFVLVKSARPRTMELLEFPFSAAGKVLLLDKCDTECGCIWHSQE